MHRKFLVVLFLIMYLAARDPQAGEQLLDPATQPLVVVAAPSPGRIEELFDTSQVRLLGYSDWDYAGTLPGLRAEVDSLRLLMKTLAAGQARDFWYCVSQSGGTLTSQSAALGFLWQLDETQFSRDDFARWLEDNAFSPDGLALAGGDVGSGGQRLTVAGDAAALEALYTGKSGRFSRDDAWRDGLRAFLEAPGGALGIYINPKPVLGLAALLSGVELKTVAAKAGLLLPDSATLALFRSDDDLGFEIRLGRVLPRIDVETVATHVFTSKPALVSVSLANPFGTRQTVEWLGNPLSGLNLDARPLLPRAACFDWWLDAAGENRWSLVLLLANGEAAIKQGARLWALVEAFANARTAPLSIEHGAGSNEVLTIQSGGVTAHVRTIVDGENLFLVAAGDARDLPTLGDIRVEESGTPTLVEWRVGLDETAAGDLAAVLANMAARFELPMGGDAFAQLLRVPDQGYLKPDGDDIVLHSRHGTAALLAPATAGLAKSRVEAYKRDPERLAAARLRWLLEAAGAWRLRRAASEGGASPLPAALSGLVPANREERKWLEGTLANFPGGGAGNSRQLERLAQGEKIDGYAYRVGTGGEWCIEADNIDTGTTFRIDAHGVCSRRRDGKWEEYPPTLIDLFIRND